MEHHKTGRKRTLDDLIREAVERENRICDRMLALSDDETISLMVDRLDRLHEKRRRFLTSAVGPKKSRIISTVRATYVDVLSRNKAVENEKRRGSAGSGGAVHSRPGKNSKSWKKMRKSVVGMDCSRVYDGSADGKVIDEILSVLASFEDEREAARDFDAMTLRDPEWLVESDVFDYRFARSMMMDALSRVWAVASYSMLGARSIKSVRTSLRKFYVDFSNNLFDGAFVRKGATVSFRVDDPGNTEAPSGRNTSGERSAALVARAYNATTTVLPDWPERERARLTVLLSERLGWGEAWRREKVTSDALRSRVRRLLEDAPVENSTGPEQFSTGRFRNASPHDEEAITDFDFPAEVHFLCWVREAIPATSFTPFPEVGHDDFGDEHGFGDPVPEDCRQ